MLNFLISSATSGGEGMEVKYKVNSRAVFRGQIKLIGEFKMATRVMWLVLWYVTKYTKSPTRIKKELVILNSDNFNSIFPPFPPLLSPFRSFPGGSYSKLSHGAVSQCVHIHLVPSDWGRSLWYQLSFQVFIYMPFMQRSLHFFGISFLFPILFLSYVPL